MAAAHGRWAILIAVVAVCLSGCWQPPAEVRVPDGPRHFIVLADAEIPPSSNREALMTAEKALTSMLYDNGVMTKGPWYRNGKDLLSVVQYGVGDKKVRLTVHADSALSRRSLLRAIRPRAYLDAKTVSAVATAGVGAAAVPNRPVQETYVILINAGASHVTNIFGSAGLDTAWRRQVRKSLSVSEYPERSFGQGTARAFIDLAEVKPRARRLAARTIARQHPLDSMSLRENGDELTAEFDFDGIPLGESANLSLVGQGETVRRTLTLWEHNSVRLRKPAGQRAVAGLAISLWFDDPILGRSQLVVYSEQPVLLPAGARSRLLWVIFFVLAIAGAAGVWAYRQALGAGHFKMWLPGYVTSFELPPLSQVATSHHVLRQPTETGELAAVLTLPPKLIRWIFYRQATLRWDARLQLIGGPENTVAVGLTDLPRATKLVWRDRPRTAGEFELTIENGRNRRATIDVRFLALPNPKRTLPENL